VLDVDRRRLARRVRLGEQLGEQLAPDPPAAVLGEQGDVDDAQLLVPAADIEAARRLAVDDDDLVGRVFVVVVVVAVLGLELLRQEGVDLLLRPAGDGQLLLARAGVDA
jgi:hypothetical protein